METCTYMVVVVETYTCKLEEEVGETCTCTVVEEVTYTCMASCAVVVGTCICKPVAVAEETYTCKAGGVVGSRPEEVVAETYTCKQVEGEVGTCSSKAVEEMSNGSLQRFQKASLGKW